MEIDSYVEGGFEVERSFPKNQPMRIIFSKSKRNSSAYCPNQAESRLKNDIVEYETKRITTSLFNISISNYEVLMDGSIILYAQIEGMFRIKFIFPIDYPFCPPTISFYSGHRYDLFDMEDNIILPCLKKWSPVLSLNTMLYDIELKLYELQKNTFGTKIIKKKKFYEYVEESRKYIKNDMHFDIYTKLKDLKLSEV